MVKMDTASDSQTSKFLPVSGTNCIGEEIIESHLHEKSILASLASDLVHLWMNQALDNFVFTFVNIFYRSDRRTRNGNHNENGANNSSSRDLIISSVPSLKQMCHDALKRSDSRLMNVLVSQFCDEEKQAHSKLVNDTETGKGEVKSLEADRAGNHSQHNSALSSDLCDLATEIDNAELNAVNISNEFLRNVDISDETLNQIPTSGSQHLPAVRPILNVASSTVEDMSNSFNSQMNSNIDTHVDTAHTLGLIDGHDERENIVSKATNPDTYFLSDDWNSTNNGSQMCLFGPGVQVSFLFFICILSHCFIILISYCIVVQGVECYQNFYIKMNFCDLLMLHVNKFLLIKYHTSLS